MDNLPPPPAFLDRPGQPSLQWNDWQSSFENYMLASGKMEATFSEQRRVATLIHCLGIEGQRIYNSLRPDPAPATLVAAFSLLAGQFAPRENVVAKRVKFGERKQLEGERFDDWYADLKRLISECRYGDMEDQLLRDHIVRCTNSRRIRERLLIPQEPELTAEQARHLALGIEQAITDAKVIEGQRKPEAIQRVKNEPHKGQPSSTGFGAKGRDPGKPCGYCGNTGHRGKDPKCPAHDQFCSFCSKKGHFARVCRKQKAGSSRQQQVRLLQDDAGSGVEREEFEDTVHVLRVKNRPQGTGQSIWVTLHLSQGRDCSTPVNAVLDTGSSASILPVTLFKEKFGNAPLQPTLQTAHGYGKHSLQILGSFETIVRYKSAECQGKFLVVDIDDSPLLGLDLFRALGMRIQDSHSVDIRHLTTVSVKERYPNLFSDKIGCLKGFMHRIKLKPGAKPVAHQLRRPVLSLHDKAIEALLKMEREGKIERAGHTDFVHPMVVVPKPNSEEVRVCCDLRELNKVVESQRFPMPTNQEIFADIGDSKVFAKFDFRQAYHQIQLAPESRPLTAFLTPIGVFQYCVLPMGYKNAGSVFQQAMTMITAGIDGTLPLMDDSLVHAPDEQILTERVEKVLQRFSEYDATLEPKKMVLCAKEIKFAGHQISANGIKPLTSNVKAIQDMPTPKTKKEMMTFIGMLTYHMRFIPGFSTLVEPLRAPLREDVKAITWNEAMHKAFNTVKGYLASEPALGHYIKGQPMIVTTDASDVGIGASLSQIRPNGEESVIGYISRTLSPAERRYSVLEKEGLAVVWACERWKWYLWGNKFTIRTDQQALVSLFNTPMGARGHKPMRIARWYLRLAEYDYDVKHCPGKQNVLADTLSRLPVTVLSPTISESWADHFVAHVSSPAAVPLTEFVAGTRADPVLERVINAITGKWSKGSAADTALRPFYALRHELSVINGCLVRGENLIVVPERLRHKILELAHEGHPGIVRTKLRLKSEYWWPGMGRDAEDCVAKCEPCQSSDKTAKPVSSPVQPIAVPELPWSKVALDIAGPYATAPPSQRFLLVMQDYTSKWPEVATCGIITASTVIDFLETAFTRHGYPRELITDNGTQLVSREMESYLHEHGIRHNRTAVYNPQANGMVERLNRVLKEGLQAGYLQGNDFKGSIRELLVTYRSTPHATTGLSPYEIMYGTKRKMRTKLSNPLPKPDEPHVRKAGRVTNLQIGDYVRYRLPHAPKGMPSWSSPLRISAQKGPATFQLENGAIWNSRKLTRTPSHAAFDRGKGDSFAYPEDYALNPVEPGMDHVPAIPEAPEAAAPVAVHRPIRSRRVPEWYQAGFT